MSNLESVVEYLRANPEASRQQAMRQCGVSSRLLRQAESELERRGSRQSGGGKALLASLLLLGCVAVSAIAWSLQGDEAPAPSVVEGDRAPSENENTARELYGAMDAADPELVSESVTRLGAKDENLRLAALRYLAKVAPDDHAAELLALVEDPAERVRLAAIQTAGSLKGPGRRALVGVACDTKRPINERLLALSNLPAKPREGSVAAALEIVTLLEDPSTRIRALTQSALERLTERRPPAADRSDPAAWQRVLAEEAP